MIDALPTVSHRPSRFKSWIIKTFSVHKDDFTQIEDEFAKTNRQLRRLQLAQDNLVELVTTINQRLLAADQKHMAAGFSGAAEKKVYPFTLLDELEKLAKLGADVGGATATITDNVTKLALNHWKLVGTERVGELYNRDYSEISTAVASATYAAGTVLEIIRQGYLSDGQCIRKAIVVVAN